MSAKIVMGGVLAFALGMTEYLLVAKTSRYKIKTTLIFKVFFISGFKRLKTTIISL